MLLTFLGKGSAFNTKEGNTSAYIKEDGTLLLIDCGETVFSKIRELNLLDDVNDVCVLITHLHSDHVGSLSSLIFYCHFIKKIQLRVYYPNEAELVTYLDLCGNNRTQYDFISLHRIGNVTISPFIKVSKNTTKHVDGMNSYGYYILYKDDIIYYSGDSNEFSNPECKLQSCIEIYQVTCLADYPGNVHLSLNKLCGNIPIEHRHKVYCMHYDCDELKIEALKAGFKIV